MFSTEKFIKKTSEELKHYDGKAIIAVSGGVDSSVACILVHKIFGDRLKAVFVDTGFLRKGEITEVSLKFKKLGIPLKTVEARDVFLKNLKGVADPEKKRKIIGKTFIEIFDSEAKAFGADFLVQGTIAPDWIESGSGIRDTIKSHHNVGGLPKNMKLKLIEPLRDLYKDEVRLLAEEYGLRKDLYWSQPFPGPGLAIRVLGELTEEKINICRQANAVVCDEIFSSFEKKEIPSLPWQYFAVVLDSKSVGIQGDIRAYGYTIAVRAVEATDGLTATYARLPQDLLEKISIRITNELKGVNRVVYDVTHKPPGSIEWE
ncbi:glutamine-hydrolyzing GMP synthase [Candidatus Micrarchaeota archaeon]|nr:glutamine-hydrolyzing GMP synthase [Candidatus Micrarchaeota archaeon]